MKKFIRGFGYAFNGLVHAARTQLNFRVHLVLAFIAIYAGYALQINVSEWLWIALSITLVLMAELLNTALEFLTDLVSPEYNKTAGQVKDMGAAAVVIAAVFAMVTGAIIFLPKLLLLIHAT